MMYKQVPKRLIRETKAIIRLYLFLRHECGLKEVDRLDAEDLRELLRCSHKVFEKIGFCGKIHIIEKFIKY